MSSVLEPSQAIHFETPNPKRNGTAACARYEKYMTATTVREALDLGATLGDLAYDEKRGFLTRCDRAADGSRDAAKAPCPSASSSSSLAASSSKKRKASTAETAANSGGNPASGSQASAAVSGKKARAKPSKAGKLQKKASAGSVGESAPVRRRLRKKQRVPHLQKKKQPDGKKDATTDAAKKEQPNRFKKLSDDELGFRLFAKRHRSKLRSDPEQEKKKPPTPEALRKLWKACSERTELMAEARSRHTRETEKKKRYQERGSAFTAFSRQLLRQRKALAKDRRSAGTAEEASSFRKALQNVVGDDKGMLDPPALLLAPQPARSDQPVCMLASGAGSEGANGFYDLDLENSTESHSAYKQRGGTHSIRFGKVIAGAKAWYIVSGTDVPMYRVALNVSSDSSDTRLPPLVGWMPYSGNAPVPELSVLWKVEDSASRVTLADATVRAAEPRSAAEAALQVLRENIEYVCKSRGQMVASLLRLEQHVNKALLKIDPRSASQVYRAVKHKPSKSKTDDSFCKHLFEHSREYPEVVERLALIAKGPFASRCKEFCKQMKDYRDRLHSIQYRAREVMPSEILSQLDLSVGTSTLRSVKKMKGFQTQAQKLVATARALDKLYADQKILWLSARRLLDMEKQDDKTTKREEPGPSNKRLDEKKNKRSRKCRSYFDDSDQSEMDDMFGYFSDMDSDDDGEAFGGQHLFKEERDLENELKFLAPPSVNASSGAWDSHSVERCKTIGELRQIGDGAFAPTTAASIRALSGMEPLRFFDALLNTASSDAKGNESPWFPLSEDVVSAAAVPEGTRSMEDCVQVWSDVQQDVYGTAVTVDYMKWVKEGKPHSPKTPLPFGASGRAGSRWYCELCECWFEAATRKDHDLCGMQGGKPRRFGPQTIGDSFDVVLSCIRGASENDPVRVQVKAAFAEVLARLNFGSYWQADQSRVSFRFLRNANGQDEQPASAKPASASGSADAPSASSACKKDASEPEPQAENQELQADAGGANIFSLASCADMSSASPPNGFRLPLFPAQLKTLSWMLTREETALEYLSREVLRRTCLETDVDVELRVERQWQSTRGGILADSVGYGKTACLIALIQEGLRKPLVDVVPAEERRSLASRFVLTNATLVVTPPNLFEQWLGEFQKFLEPGVFNTVRIVEIPHIQRLKSLTVEDIANADVVIVPYRFFFSPTYERHLDEAIQREEEENTSKGSRIQTSRFEAKRYTLLRKLTAKLLKGSTAAASGEDAAGTAADERRTTFCDQELPATVLDSTAPVLESFHWRRVVFDEFHEVLNIRQGRPYHALRQLFAKFHWGLTATPCLSDARAVSDMASLLHISIPTWSNPEAQHFLDEWVRSSSWDTRSVPLRNEIIPVHHTKQERLLYLHERSQLLNREGRASKQAEERLLQLCSHYSPGKEAPGDGSAATAVVQRRNELHNELEQTRDSIVEPIRELPKQVRRKDAMYRLQKAFRAAGLPSGAAGRFASLAVGDAFRLAGECAAEDMEAYAARFEAHAAFVAEPGAAPVAVDDDAVEDERDVIPVDAPEQGDRDSVPLVALGSGEQPMALPADLQELIAKLAAIVRRTRQRNYKPTLMPTGKNGLDLVSHVREQEGFIERQQKRIEQLESSTRFFDNALQCLEGGDEQHFECPVCMDDSDPSPRAITRCGHVFHHKCLKLVVNEMHSCPTCRVRLTQQDFSFVQQALADCSAPGADEGDESDAPMYGSKLAKIVERLRSVRAEEPGAKVIIFCQWEKILKFVADALARQGEPPPLVLRGHMLQRQHVLRDFTSSTDPRHSVLLLSLEQSPTGMNLVCCRHLFLVHPFFAQNRERAVAFELQAIGRLRRQGQQREVVVHRFVTQGTVEEEITQRHQTHLDEVCAETAPATTSVTQCSVPAVTTASSSSGGIGAETETNVEGEEDVTEVRLALQSES
eukprot:TRINITY_DN9251_c0_g1_i1.p1 TRINITY_DN9251_c0_g1~~TRINITY_DN9251_c0_g1_i1.p1  ORF type:complete len:1925 (+),score=388.99 TRINITY_DN9251_c0_g1_i1:49-5823(+)